MLAHFLSRSSAGIVCTHRGTHGHAHTHTCQVEMADQETRWNVCESIGLRDTDKQSHVPIADSQFACLRGAAVKGAHGGPSEPSTSSTLLERSNFATFTTEDILRGVRIEKHLHIKKVCGSRPPRKMDGTRTCSKCVPWERTLTPFVCGFSLTLHQLDPEVGNEKEQQQSHGQEDAREQEPAWELSQELRQYGAHCHITPLIPPNPGPVGFALRWGQLRWVHTCFLLGLWPLLSTSQWNFLWTLLYLNSPMNSERIAGRLLCNSATKCRGIERWFSQAIPEMSIYLARLGMTPGDLNFFVFSLSDMKSTWL